jgi:NitT/TauT family transport system ATP-binding protein
VRVATLSVEHVTKCFGDGEAAVTAVEDFSFDVAEGEFVTLIGPSGCGKTTLFQIIGGLTGGYQGRVRVAGETITGPHPAIGMVFQEESTFPWRSVIDNVAFGLEVAGIGRSERYERARAMLAAVGLSGFDRHLPRQLSGGMRQRVALARALIMERPILLMDEPFAALDAQTKIVMQEELLRIFEATRKTVLFVTHAIDEAILLGDEIVVMTARPGRIKEVIPIDLPRPRSFDLVNTKEFGALFQHAFHLIREEVTRAMSEQASEQAA